MVFRESLPLFRSDKPLRLPRSPDARVPALASDAPAIAAMTDFLRTPAMSVLATTQIDVALERTDVTVRDIMEPVASWKTLRHEALSGATVADVARTFANQPRRHLVVLEAAPGGGQIVRGMFSASFLERALGGRIETREMADTFAEIERALVQ